MISLAKSYEGKLVFLAVSVDHDEAAMHAFLAKQNYGTETLVVWDKSKVISQDLFQSIRYPETIIISPAGLMVEKIAGYMNWAAPEMRTRLNALLGP